MPRDPEPSGSLVQGNEPHAGGAAEVFQRDYDRIFRYVLSMVRDEAEAEDLVQETFLRAYRARDSLQAEAAQTAWLYRIATHASLDRLRQRTRRAPMETDTDLDEVDVDDADAPSLQKSMEHGEMSDCVQGYLNRLSDSYRSVILLHDVHELTALEISQLLHEPLTAIKIRLRRARLKLKAALEAGCEFSHDESSTLTCQTRD